MQPILRQYGRARPASGSPAPTFVWSSPSAKVPAGHGQSQPSVLAETPDAAPAVKPDAASAWAAVFRTPGATVGAAATGTKRPRPPPSKPSLASGVAHLDFDARSATLARRRPVVSAGSSLSTPSAPLRAPTLTQLVLDVGQRDVEHRACGLCGMVYGHGLAADEAAHARWCQAARVTARGGAEQPLLVLSGWRSAGRVVEAASPVAAAEAPPPRADRADIRRHFGPAAPAEAGGSEEGRGADPTPSTPAVARTRTAGPPSPFSIVHIPWAAAGAAPALAAVRSLLDSELGEASCPVRRIGVGPPAPDVHYFVALAPGDLVAGVVVTERVETAFRVRLTPAEAPAAGDPSLAHAPAVGPSAAPGPCPAEEPAACAAAAASAPPPQPPPFCAPQPVSAALCLDEPVRAVLGIAQVWVAPAHRRCGVARALLASAAAHAVYGYAVPSAEVAFSQTTAAGAQLAAAYAGRPDFCVYL